MPARNHMHVQLRHLVAERGDIEFLAFGDGFERARRGGDFAQQLHLLVFFQVDELDQPRLPRHQDQPGIIGVVRQAARARAPGRRPEPCPARVAGGGTRSSRSSRHVSCRPGQAPVRARERDPYSAVYRECTEYGSPLSRGRPNWLACFPPPLARYRSREVGGGRATRQPGQVRKEAALTSTDRVARQPPTHFRDCQQRSRRGRRSDGTMSETAKPTGLDLGARRRTPAIACWRANTARRASTT